MWALHVNFCTHALPQPDCFIFADLWSRFVVEGDMLVPGLWACPGFALRLLVF